MADIARYPLIRHLRGSGTSHVEQIRNGRTVRAGVGASFWFRPLSAVLNEIPVDDRELPLMFHARTSDFQDVTVQATITYRVTDPAAAAGRIDFSIDPDTGLWRSTPLDQVASLLTESAQQYAIDLLATVDLNAAMAGGVGPVRISIADGLAGDARLTETGIAVVGVRVGFSVGDWIAAPKSTSSHWVVLISYSSSCLRAKVNRPSQLNWTDPTDLYNFVFATLLFWYTKLCADPI
mgnify:CR=1 FL=1